MIKIKKINDKYNFRALENLAPKIHPIHMLSPWLETYHQNFPLAINSFVMEVYDGELIGALLLSCEYQGRNRCLALRNWIPYGSGPSDFFDFFCREGLEKFVANEISKWLRLHWWAWDSLELKRIPRPSLVWNFFFDCLKEDNFDPITKMNSSYYFIDTSTSWDEYVNKMGAEKTKEIRYYKNRLMKDGVDTEFIIQRSEISLLLPELVEMYRTRRFFSNQKDPFQHSPQFYKFLINVIDQYQERGWVQLSMLKSRSSIIAFSINWYYGGVLYYYMPAFDEKFKKYSPGKILLFEIIKNAFIDEQVSKLNFMRGTSSYKSFFANERVPYILIELKNPKSIIMRLKKLISKN